MDLTTIEKMFLLGAITLAEKSAERAIRQAEQAGKANTAKAIQEDVNILNSLHKKVQAQTPKS